MTKAAVLFSEMTPDPSWEGEFHTWYDTEHIPLRMAVPGFRSARRYSADDGRGFLAVYEMDSPQVLQSATYGEVKNKPSELTARMLRDVSGFTRYTTTEFSEHVQGGLDASAALDAPFLYSVFFTVPKSSTDLFDAWYEEDHIPILMECEDWLMVRRFDIVSGDPENYTHMALHYLRDLSALNSPARAKARATNWRAKLATEPWFKGIYRTFSLMRTFEATHGGGKA